MLAYSLSSDEIIPKFHVFNVQKFFEISSTSILIIIFSNISRNLNFFLPYHSHTISNHTPLHPECPHSKAVHQDQGNATRCLLEYSLVPHKHTIFQTHIPLFTPTLTFSEAERIGFRRSWGVPPNKASPFTARKTRREDVNVIDRSTR